MNIAARIVPLGGAGGICISQQVFDQVENHLAKSLKRMGSVTLKNIKQPLEVYWVEYEGATSGPPNLEDEQFYRDTESIAFKETGRSPAFSAWRCDKKLKKVQYECKYNTNIKIVHSTLISRNHFVFGLSRPNISTTHIQHPPPPKYIPSINTASNAVTPPRIIKPPPPPRGRG